MWSWEKAVSVWNFEKALCCYIWMDPCLFVLNREYCSFIMNGPHFHADIGGVAFSFVAENTNKNKASWIALHKPSCRLCASPFLPCNCGYKFDKCFIRNCQVVLHCGYHFILVITAHEFPGDSHLTFSASISWAWLDNLPFTLIRLHFFDWRVDAEGSSSCTDHL